jgi:hypothetical protein
MPIEGIGNPVQNLADQRLGPLQEAPAGAPAPTNAAGGPVAQDTFTPSTQSNSAQATAQEAGIFQPPNGTLAAVTANLLFGQPAQPGPNVLPPQAANGANGGAAPAPASNLLNATAAQNAAQPAAVAQDGAPTSANTAASTVEVQNKLKALNAALPALGLTNAEIQQIDRIASLVQDFNPAAYANLVSQFEALAQQKIQQNPNNASANGIAAAGTGAAANGAGFQVQGISIQFAGPAQSQTANVPGQNTANPGAPAVSTQPNAAGLQIAQAQFTLANGAGQTINIQVPQLPQAVQATALRHTIL